MVVSNIYGGGSIDLKRDEALEFKKPELQRDCDAETTPSVYQTIESQILEYEGMENTTFDGVRGPDVSDGGDNKVHSCEFKRDGYCVEHGSKGMKSTVTSKVWSREKHGIYGLG